MSAQMDCFVDEVKDGGTVISLGILIVEAGVLEGIDGALNRPIEKRTGSGATVGEIHWSKLGDLEAGVAKEWLTSFLQGPLMFFVLAPVLQDEDKAGTLKRVITVLEEDSRVMGGFSRQTTTVHFDTDSSDPKDLLRGLRREYGVLRAFKWDSKGSRLLQLCDLLLGIATHLSRGDASACEAVSVGEQRRQNVVTFARSEAQRFARHGKVNAILELSKNRPRFLLSEQSGGAAPAE